MFNILVHKMFKWYSGGGRMPSRVLYRLIRWYYHCDIPYNINLNGVWFCHNGFGIVINANAQIGEGCYIQHGVTIGVRDDIQNTKAPRIGKNCYIGARAILIGDIAIGDNVKIGAGAVVISDIPNGATAVGVPAKIVKNNNGEKTSKTFPHRY